MEHAKNQSKPQGNLRDFRIDGAPQSASRNSAPQDHSRAAPQKPAIKQEVKVRSFASPAKQQNAKLMAQPNLAARPLTTEKKLDLPYLDKKTTQAATTAPTPKMAPKVEESRWQLADSGLSAEEENLWGLWKNDVSESSVSLTGTINSQLSVDLGKATSTHLELRSLDEIETPRRVSALANPSTQTDNTPTTSNLKQLQEDTQAANQEESMRLATENFGRFPWAVELAQSERRAERLGVVDYANGFQKHEILKLRTREFMARLHAAFREQVEIFNESRKSPAHAIQIYKVNNTAEDFMLFRNGIKLVISGEQAGRILFAFNQFMGEIYNNQQNMAKAEINALWGPFEQLVWQYKGERVQTEDVVRYFITEFVKQSFR